MGSNHIHKHVIAYLEKTLPADLYNEMENHISSCRSCKELVDKVASVYCFAGKDCPDLDPFFASRVEARLNRKSEPEYFLPVSIIKSLRPVALCLLLLTTVTFSIFMGNYLLSNKAQKSYSSNGKESVYEYYLSVNEDQVVTQIINNEQ
jgi:hypothetical protein